MVGFPRVHAGEEVNLYILVTESVIVAMVIVPALCALAATAGQWLLYQGFNDEVTEERGIARAVPYLDRVPSIVRRRVGADRMAFINRQFDRYGGKAICLSNATPGLRGLMSAIAGLNGYPQRRFVLLSALGNAIYMVILVAVANGLLEAVRFLPDVEQLLTTIAR
ncbi:DedA family protein [Natronolimnohabitans innermongolicus]|uniref:VTT domain-containing protein n=1 Tax=Natronolimnohabitans innermongolicus JCM 12255 TaxID=1227499 RepID=L9XC56_9EURY|nr:VTT domain-containing protein [Natronolimnohabitans innermongolicus]ELY58996.1 hypothetical protein C493_06105 [Natronolimnohabitans innermongolicus JCM 12255]